MRIIIIILILICSFGLYGQGIEPTSFQPTPYEGGVLRGIIPYEDPFTGDTLYIYQHDSLAVASADSIYISNDTIFLRDGSGFVLIPKGGTVKGSGVATRVAFWGGVDSLSSDADLYWDNTNKRLGIGMTNPAFKLDVSGGDARINFAHIGLGGGNIASNLRFGFRALDKNTSGTGNLAIGALSLDNNTTGFSNTAIGRESMFANTTARDNVAVGQGALYSINSNYNVGVGSEALYNTTTGNINTALGYRALRNGTGSGNIGIGFQAGLLNGANSNRLFIENSSSTTPLIGGQFNTDRVGINRPIEDIQSTLHVGGDVRVDTRTGTGTKLTMWDANNRLVEGTLGTGLEIVGGTLSSTVVNTDNQNLSFTAPNLSISGGNSVDISAINTDSQNLTHTVSGTDRTINISGGTGITINVADNDNDSTNELQTISKSGSTVTLSNGGGSFTDDNTTYTAGTGISISGGNVITNTGDLSNTNELITAVTGGLSGSTGYNINITEAGVTRTATVTGMVGATASTNGDQGLVPRPLTSNRLMFLRGDGTWQNPQLGMQSWNLGINNGSYSTIVDGQDVTFNAGTNVTLSKSGSTVTINSTAGGSNWFLDNSVVYNFGASSSGLNSGRATRLGQLQGGLSNQRFFDVNGDAKFRSAIYDKNDSRGSNGQVLTSNGTDWTWQTPSAGANQTISKTGNTVNLTGSPSSSFNIASTTPSNNQVLTWNGSNWVASTPLAAQELFFTPKSGGSVPLNLTGSAPVVNFADGTGINLTRSGNTMTINATNTLPSGSVNNTLRYDGSNWVTSSFLSNNNTRININNWTNTVNTGSRLLVNGFIQYNPTGFNATTLAGRDTDGGLTGVTVGSGLSLSGGTLSASGGSYSHWRMRTNTDASTNVTDNTLVSFNGVGSIGTYRDNNNIVTYFNQIHGALYRNTVHSGATLSTSFTKVSYNNAYANAGLSVSTANDNITLIGGNRYEISFSGSVKFNTNHVNTIEFTLFIGGLQGNIQESMIVRNHEDNAANTTNFSQTLILYVDSNQTVDLRYKRISGSCTSIDLSNLNLNVKALTL